MIDRLRVGEVIARAGLVPILERVNRRRCLLVLGYHRIGNATESDFDEDVFTATADEFDQQIAVLKKRYRVVTLPEAIDVVTSRRRLRSPMVLLTFDDGYRDNYTLAYPILRSHGVQATFFLVTSMLTTPSIPWWDRVAWMVRRTTRSRIRLRTPVEQTIDLPPGRRQREIDTVLNAYKDPRTTDGDAFMAMLEDECDVPQPGNGEPLFLDAAEAREMAQGGMAIGSHTHTHRILARLSESEQSQELTTSRAELERVLGTSVDALAYPVGERTCFDDRTRAVARAAGFRAAFSYYGGTNRPGNLDPFDIRRTSVFPRSDPDRFRYRVAMPLLMDGHWY